MKKESLLTNCVFVGFIFFFFFAHLLLPDQTMSEEENRTLTLFPKIKGEEILSGKTARSLETYIQDQFPWRANFVEAKSKMDTLIGKELVNGVYIEGDTLLQQFNTLDESRYSTNIRKINEFAQATTLPVDVLVIPSSLAIHEDLLPHHHQDLDQKELLQRIENDLSSATLINPLEKLMKSETNPFYRTDHHLTSQGSYITYQAYRENLNQESTDFSFTSVSTGFKGTLSSKSGAFWIQGDEILKPQAENEITVQVQYEGQGEFKDSLYSEENLQKKDQYTYYLDGNHALVEITTNQIDKENLLVITDSYGHSLAPFLVADYHQITFVDLRYYHGPISELLSDYNRVLVYYGIESFVSDVNIAWLK